MADPPPQEGQLALPANDALAVRDGDERSRSSRHPEGLAQGSTAASMASDILIDTPEQGYHHSMYPVNQHNALHEHLQAQYQLHFHQGDKSPQVEEIAELLHQQAMLSQRAQMEAMAYEQVAETQRRANAEHEAAMRKMQADATKKFMEASIEAHGRQVQLQQQGAESRAEAERAKSQLTATSLRENQLLESMREQEALIKDLRRANEQQAQRFVDQDRELREMRDTLRQLTTRPDGSERIPEGKAVNVEEQELIPDDAYQPTSPVADGLPPGGPPGDDDDDDGSFGDPKRGRKLKKDKHKKDKKKKKKSKKHKRSPSGSSPSSSSSTSSSSSSSEKRMRRRLRRALEAEGLGGKGKESDKILVPKFPKPEAYRNWRIRVRDAVAAASKDPDRAISWFDKVYKDKVTMEDLADSEGMATLDAKLLSSLTNIVEGDLARRLDNIKERALMKGESTRGRQALWLFHDHFSTHIHLGAVYALEDLMSVRMKNDDLKTFISNWDSVLAGLQKHPDKDVLQTYFHMNIKRFKPMEHDLNVYERSAIGSQEGSYEWLYEKANQYLERRRLEKMRDATRNRLAGRDGTGAPAPEAKLYCYAFQRGECKKGQSCPFLHEKDPKGKGKGRGKGKDKGKRKKSTSRSPSRSLSPGSRNQVCKFWKANGSCHRGDKCAFQHPPKLAAAASTDGDKKKKKKKDKKDKKDKKSSSRSSSRSSAGSGSQKKKTGHPKGGGAGSAAVCLMRALVLAAVIQPSRGILVKCRAEAPTVERAWKELRFAENDDITTFDALEDWDLRKPGHSVNRGKRLGKYPKLDHGKIADSIEDAVLAGKMLESSVSNWVGGKKTKCKYVCDSDLGCKHCIATSLQTSGPDNFPRGNAVATASAEIAWIADTGASQDLICEGLVDKSKVREAEQPLNLTTANGTKVADKQTSYHVNIIDADLEPYVLEDTPSVISVGRKCIKEGWDFVWRAFSRPYFRKPDGPKIKLEVHDYVPYLPSSTGVAMTTLGMNYVSPCTEEASSSEASLSKVHEESKALPVESSVAEDDDPMYSEAEDEFEYEPEISPEDLPSEDEHISGEVAPGPPSAVTPGYGDEEKTAEQSEDEKGDEGPPTDVESDERLVIKPREEERSAGKEALRREACSLQHLMTHTPKNPFCNICNRARMTKKTARSHGESKHVKAEKFGDHVTADHLINFGERNEGDDGELVAMVFKDVYTDVRYCYPSASKHTRECVAAMKHFIGPKVEVGVFYSDEAPELKRAAAEMKWRHHVGTAYVSQTNAVAERNLRSIMEGTRANLLQSGLNHKYWPYAAKHSCMAHNIAEDYEVDSPWKIMTGKRWKGPQIPFGARVDYWTGPKRRVKPAARFDPSTLPGVFLGYPLHPGLVWRGDFLVAPLKEIMDKPFEETVTVIRANNMALPDSGITFPLRLRHECMLEGLWPLSDRSLNPDRRSSQDASLQPELLEETAKEKDDRLQAEAEDFEKSLEDIQERRTRGDYSPVGPERAVEDGPVPDKDENDHCLG